MFMHCMMLYVLGFEVTLWLQHQTQMAPAATLPFLVSSVRASYSAGTCSWRITIIKHTCGVLQGDTSMIQRMVKLSLWMDLRYRLRCHWCVRVSGLNFKVQIQWERGHQRSTLNMQCRSMQCKQYQDHKFRTDAGQGMSLRAFWTEG